MDVVKSVLQKVEDKNKKVSNVKVKKLIDVECFLQDFVVIDTNEVNLKEIRSDDGEEYMQNVCRDNMQIFVNQLLELPVEKQYGQSFIKLPDSVFPLPREKPIPAPKPLTKWQKFAKEKGIQKTKKPKSTWDDILQRWVPRYGYKKAAAEKEKDWILEVPKNKDPNTDMFAEKRKVKKERVAKNEYSRLRNIAESKNIKIPKFGLPPLEGHMHIPQIQMAANIAKISTASIGKFQEKLPHEDTKKNNLAHLKKKKKRVMDSETERKTNISLAEGIIKKKPILDITKAVNKKIHEEQIQRSSNKKDEKKLGKRKRGPKNEKNLFKKPVSHKGKRVGKKQNSGRKRR